jgi:integrase/recombinase XerD
MFDEIFFPRTAEKHRAAALAEPRARYLRHLKEIGTRRSALRKCANDHLNLVRLLNPQDDDRISIHGIETAAAIWSRPKGRRCDNAATAKARKRFMSMASICCAFWAGSMNPKSNFTHIAQR